MKSSVLTDKQIEKIHAVSLDMLERIGLEVPHPDMLKRFADAGARVDFSAQRVKIPPRLVADALETAGKTFTLFGRDPRFTARFGQGSRNYNSIAGEAYWVEEPGGERRFATLEDVAAASRFGGALPNINIVGAMSDPHELPVSFRCVAVMAEMLKHTLKPITFWFHDRASARFINEIMIALRGDETRAAAQPVCYPFFEPISPLRFPFHGIDLLYETARLNLPVPIGPMAQMGVSAPMSLAGLMAQENAEILAGICITQLIRKGMPVCYGGICHAFDMRTTQMIFGGPEQAILGVGMTQMGKHYGLPVSINVGLTDSKRPDAQAGMECAATLTLGAAAGADIFGHMGIAGVDQAASLDMLVLQNEVIGYVESAMRELEFSDEAIGLDVLAELGPGGSFIAHEHTAARFRRELWASPLADREYYEAWRAAGARSLEARCAERKREILSGRAAPAEPVSPDFGKELQRIVAAARKELELVEV